MTRTIIKESGKVHTPCFLYYYNFCLCKIYQISLCFIYPVFRESGCKGMIFFATDQILNEKNEKNNSFFRFSLIEIKENEKQNRQMTVKTSLAYPKIEKVSIYFPYFFNKRSFSARVIGIIVPCRGVNIPFVAVFCTKWKVFRSSERQN